MIAALLTGCTPDPIALPVGEESGLTAPPSGGAPFVEPPVAPDLDPSEGVVRVALTAAEHTFEVDGRVWEGFAYQGSVPGPTLEAVVGQTLVVELTNALPVPTTVHWHGIHVPAEMDGAGWPMPTLGPGETFTASFVVDRPGTFWYHPHFDTEHQVDRGLYGVVVVRDPSEPAVDRELVLVMDSFGEPEAAEADPHVVDPSASRWAVNGVVAPRLELPSGARVRARLLNASNAGLLLLEDQRVLAHDQGLLAEVETGLLALAPGDRAEVEWDVGGELAVMRRPASEAGGEAWGEREALLTLVSDGGAPPPPLAWPTSGASPTPDPGRTDLRYLLTGSAELGWEINGETFPDVTVPAVPLGSGQVVEVRNASPSNHPFHVHGHAFEVLSVDGVPPPRRRIEDTLDVPIRGIARLLLVADNPGLWMTHCHLLPHAEGGMMTLLEVR